MVRLDKYSLPLVFAQGTKGTKKEEIVRNGVKLSVVEEIVRNGVKC